jgi:hypothetical protein
MAIERDTFTALADGTPAWFTNSARPLPDGLLGRFGLAGAALYGSVQQHLRLRADLGPTRLCFLLRLRADQCRPGTEDVSRC